MPISLPAEGQGPKEIEKKTEQLERAFKPMPFLSKFWEIQVRVDLCTALWITPALGLITCFPGISADMFSRARH